MEKEKRIDSDDVLNTILSDNTDVIIYGAGNYGHTLMTYVKEFFKRDLNHFAVSVKDHANENEDELIDVITDCPRDSHVIIAVSEQHQDELRNNLISNDFQNYSSLLNDFFRYMSVKLDVDRLKVKETLEFEVHITEHCNLNCRGCYHFSPLAEKTFLDIDEYSNDLRQIQRLCGDKVGRITLLGGEPLLHPEIKGFISTTRDLFPKTRIEILTNGILLKDMDEAFWQLCSDCGIFLCCTKYPIAVDYDQIEKKARNYNLSITYHNDVGAGEKTLIKYPFDVSGKQNQEETFLKCTRSNLCITLKHGKLYPCPMAAHAHLAKDFFNLDIELSDDDYVDIYKAESMSEIMSFFVKPINFCKYCNLQRRPEQMKWGTSERKYGEWF